MYILSATIRSHCKIIGNLNTIYQFYNRNEAAFANGNEAASFNWNEAAFANGNEYAYYNNLLKEIINSINNLKTKIKDKRLNEAYNKANYLNVLAQEEYYEQINPKNILNIKEILEAVLKRIKEPNIQMGAKYIKRGNEIIFSLSWY